jgi:anti-sigma-K factor RskA
MSDKRPTDIERLEELLADRASVGLSSDEQRELEALLARAQDEGPEALELAAAALELALGPAEHAPIPAELKTKLQVRADAFVAQRAALAKRADMRALPPTGPRGASSIAWWIAAAAVVLALVGWWPRLAPNSRDLAGERAELLARADVLRVDAKGTELAKDAIGDVVWSNREQQGFLRVTGLGEIDPHVMQYQLWIFDEKQEHPIDGGVFDGASTGELLIPINAKLRVGKPKLFAVTVEKAGGVVVSDQKRIALVAAL